MTKVYEYPRVVSGETRREHVYFSSDIQCDFLQIVHNVAVDLCLKNEDRQLCKEDGMSFAQAMEYVTPEMLAPYGVTMIRSTDAAIQTDQLPPLVNRYELETIRDVRKNERRRALAVVEYAERAARRLETQRANQHPVVSTWGSEKISERAASWAWQFVVGKEKDFGEFVEKRLNRMLTHPAYRDLSPDHASGDPETYDSTVPVPAEETAVGEVPITQ